jgi:antitoxin CcdA
MSGPGAGSLGAMEAAQKRPVNLSVSVEILTSAREAEINLSALLERALTGELGTLRRRRWHEENLRAVLAYNEHLASHGTCFEGRLDE